MPRTERPHMPEYGVTQDPIGLLGWDWAAERLAGTRNFWVATASADGRPHCMPVWGIWIPESETFWFSCGFQARKGRNLAENPRVVVAIDDTVEVVSVEGTATEVQSSEIPDIIERFARRYEDTAEKQAELIAFMAETRWFCVAPERAFGIIERPEEFGPCATRWVW